MIAEAERRASNSLTEYTTLVQDLQYNYLACRMELLQPSVKSAVAQLLTVHTRNQTGLVRASCAFCTMCVRMSTSSAVFSGGGGRRHEASVRGVS